MIAPLPRALPAVAATGALLLALASPPRPGAPAAAAAAELDPLELQARVDRVLERALPATVALDVAGARGSGVIVSPDGLVLTAAHVTGGPGREARVRLADGTELRGRTLGANHGRDSALVQIEGAAGLPFLPLPAPDAPEVGEWCLALGHPGGYQNGRPPVPRIGRVLEAGGRFPRTDCALIGGDSGGPLLDLDGELIGIHSRIELEVSDNYHVPMSSYRLSWARLVAGEEWSRKRARLGVRLSSDERDGARIESVEQASAAEAAGLLAGDLVLAIEGERVHDRGELVWLLADLAPGDEVELELLRDGAPLRVRAVLDAAERGWRER